ncbi:chemotaxis protein CheA [bacterium]|nr:MAG: chemotaxis protein CheA [bacterium]
MTFASSEMEEIINDFVVESVESLSSLDHKFVELEKNPGDRALLNEVFRAVHTIKGAAGFLGLKQIVEVTHAAEEILNRLRKGDMDMDAFVMDAILHSIDVIKVLIRNVKEKNNREEEIRPLLSLLNSILGTATVVSAPSTAPARASEPEPVSAAPSEQQASAPDLPEPSLSAAAAAGAFDEKLTYGRRTEDKEHNIRVDIDRLDSVMNLIGELVLSRNRMVTLGARMQNAVVEDDLFTQSSDAISQLDLVTTDLQLAVMKMRMQPIAKVFNKFPRLVRDLARQSGKEVELLITGEETELDKTVIEEIGDPLVHLIRNSIDHGIETSAQREVAGKPSKGILSLSAYQEGQHIIVSVSDDGKGIDPDAVRAAAVEKGLVSAEEAARKNRKEAINMIFIPGFSTAKSVSSISGRGVGMDVVHTNISRINGSIHVESEVGKGTRVVFRLPLTLAIIQALTVQAGGEVYGIPLSTVVENIRVTHDGIKSIDGKEVIHIRERVYPVVRLSALISRGVKKTSGAEDSGWKYIVIIGVAERYMGLLVDRLHGQEEIVMKSMGDYLKGTQGVAGACINGSGKVILILDVASLMESACGVRLAV